MRYLTFIRSSESYRESSPPPALMEAMGTFKVGSKAEALRIATEFMELHRQYWPGFEGESEVRPMFDPDTGP